MTELELYKFIKDNNIEYHYHVKANDEKEIVVFVDINDIKEFNKLLRSSIFEDEGLDCVMKDGYFCFEMVNICEHFDIYPQNVFEEKS